MREKLRNIIVSIFGYNFLPENHTGWTTFAPLKIKPEYINIDLEEKQVTGVVRYNGKIYLTVIVNVSTNKTNVSGNLRRIRKEIKPFNKRHCIEMIQSDAEFYIENQISNPNEL